MLPHTVAMTRAALTRAERLAVVITTVLAAIVVIAYGLDVAGVTFRPGPMLAISAGVAAATWGATTRRRSDDSWSETLTFLFLVSASWAWLLWMARPAWLPLGSGPDLTHHLLLVRYIETHWTLVHDPAAVAFLGEMTVYTPGSHILAALFGAWAGASGLHAVHPLMSAALALKVGFVFLVARRMLPSDGQRVPIAAAAALSLFAAPGMLLGSFVQFSFLAQVVAELFALAMWWTVIVWSAQPGVVLSVVGGVLGAATFLTWPLLVGPPLLVLAMLMAAGGGGSVAERWRGAALICLITGAFAVRFSVGRMGFAVIAGAPGSTVTPSVATYGWPLLLASALGLCLSATRRRTWPVSMMAGAVLMQAGGLYFFATTHNNVPYMAQKMAFLLLFVQGTAVAIALDGIWTTGWRAIGTRHRLAPGGSALLWVGAAGIAVFATEPLLVSSRTLRLRSEPAITAPLERAGLWAAAHLPPGCVDYLVPNYASAYWLHLAVLGNPRSGDRTGDSRTYDLAPSLLRWLTPGGLPYAIVDRRSVPRDIAGELDVLASFDDVAVARRRSVSACPAEPPR